MAPNNTTTEHLNLSRIEQAIVDEARQIARPFVPGQLFDARELCNRKTLSQAVTNLERMGVLEVCSDGFIIAPDYAA